jgi:hypothetical protein
MDFGSLLVAGAALVVSVFSFYFSIRSWRETNRPIVTARVTSHGGGEEGTALNIVVENTGNRPARNVRLSVSEEHLKAALSENVDEVWGKSIRRCFSDRGVIPVLANGKSVSNDFGWLTVGEKSAWRGDLRFDIEVSYEDLDGRKFKHVNPLLVADDVGFAGSFWSTGKK